MCNATIAVVDPDSIANDLGILPGDKLVAINGQPVGDIIDYLLAISDEKLEIEINKEDGVYIFEIEKGIGESLGLSFDPPTITPIKSCLNSCLFCFISQMPRGLRKSLYVKDDDYRLSFLSGSYITGTNLTDEEVARICRLHLSPLYISVHRTDQQRNELMGLEGDFSIINLLSTFKLHDIDFHTQIVLCPGLNDGDVLENSLKDLMALYPNILSLTVVPVGLTKYRKCDDNLKTYTAKGARQVLKLVDDLGDCLKEEYGKRLVYASDEFFLLADQSIPKSAYYEGYPQLENGVGMVRLLIDEFTDRLTQVDKKQIDINTEYTVATGVLAYPVIKKLITTLQKTQPNLKVTVIPIENNFFGDSVTVAGLITGEDLINSLTDVETDKIFIPESMLNKSRTCFLDDVTLEDVAEKLGKEVVPLAVTGSSLLDAFLMIKEEETCCR